jgi:dTDP-4-dehydrorhamnose 3,5-epimerase
MLNTTISGVNLCSIPSHSDLRGKFLRTFDRELVNLDNDLNIVQTSVSFNEQAGTLRGLHYQIKPAIEWKIIRCIQGEVFDVLLDLRKNEPTYGTWIANILSEENDLVLTVPPGVAHGYLTLRSNSVISYAMTDYYDRALSKRIHWNDPKLNISWISKPLYVSDEDNRGAAWPQEF